jgi:hypothetical protein
MPFAKLQNVTNPGPERTWLPTMGGDPAGLPQCIEFPRRELFTSQA